MALVALLADVGGVLLVRHDRALRRQRASRLQQGVDGALNGLLALAVFDIQLSIRRRNRHKGHNFDDLEEMVERDDRVVHHEQCLRDPQHIFERPRRLGLEVLDTVVSHVADGPAIERRQDEAGDRRDAELSEFFLEDGEGVTVRAMASAGLEDFTGIYYKQKLACSQRMVGPLHNNSLPAPTKLYLPIVSVVAALSYRNDNFDLPLSVTLSPSRPR